MRRRAVFLLLLGLFALTAASCGGGEEVAPAPETVEGTVGQQTDTGETDTETDEAETETDEAETETDAETETEGGGTAAGDAEAGKAIWDANGCGGCHVLEAAGSGGNVGPNLDESQPDTELVVDRVTNGKGVMPAFGDQLSEADIASVAAYVVESTSG